MLRRMLGYMRPYRRLLALLFTMALAVGLLNIAQPQILGRLTSALFNGRHGVELPGGRVLLRSVKSVVILPGLLLCVMLLRVVMLYIQNYLGMVIAGGAVNDLRKQVYAHMQGLSLGFFEKQPTGQLLSRVANDVSTVQTFIQTASVEMLADLVTVAAAVTAVFIIDWRLALVTMTVLLLIAWPLNRVGKTLRRAGAMMQESWAELMGVLQEALTGVRAIQAFQLESLMRVRFDRESDRIYQTGLGWARMTGALTPVMEFLGGAALAVFIWFGSYQISRGQLRPEQVLTFIFLLGFITAPITRIGKSFGQMQHALASAARVFELLDQRPRVVESLGAIVLPVLKGGVRFEKVSFAYDDGPLVLREIDLFVEPGESIALVGPSGAGKTSLVNLVPRFYDPMSGRILIDGYDLREIQMASLRAQIGIVPQETLLFRATVAENIAFGKPGASLEEIMEAAVTANAHQFIQDLPRGYGTLVGERGQTLSGGQRQRIAIARAVLRNPRILILDEATSSLDSASEAQVQGALERLMQGRTTLVIAHRLSTVQRADRLVVIDAGRIVEIGSHEQLARLGGIYAHLYEQQFKPGAV